MAGIYIHIPFCRKACHYCDFHFSTSMKTKDSVLETMLYELKSRKTELKGEDISTAYFGGGTPSLLSSDEMKAFFSALQREYVIAKDAEITLEANPEDITPEALKVWKGLGINRLSIGIQSFDEQILNWMNRAHNANEALSCVPMAQEAGISNISIDLIYGVPQRSLSDWRKEIEQALALGTTHLSAYCLTIEPNTAFGKRSKRGEKLSSPSDQSAKEFDLLYELTAEADINLYEVSNFSKPGYESKHNTSYWKGHSYLGIGPGAHSYKDGKRSWNVSNNSIYAKNKLDLESVSGSEILTPKDVYNEHIMTGLRKVTGVSSDKIRELFNYDLEITHGSAIDGFIDSGDLIRSGNHYRLSKKGILLADHIASELFQTDD